MGKTWITVVIAVIFAGCEEQVNKNSITDFSLLSQHAFVLIIDRVSDGSGVQFPHDSLHESDYIATVEDIRYEISFSENARIITIESTESDPVIGERSIDGETSKRYELDEGLFAGGRFVIWNMDDHLEAEFTIYGSGVPIIKSERGRLELVAVPS